MNRILSIALATAFAVGSLPAAEVADGIELKGDIRYRHEMIDKEGSTTRTRHRVRARVELKAEVNDTLKAAVRVASGSSDPVSSNQTLDDSFSSKGINLDKAYLDWAPEQLGGVHIIGGKMGKPWICVADLVWDGDLNPEGLAAKVSAGEDVTVTASAGGFWVDERSSTSSDAMLYAGQVALGVKGPVGLTIGAGVYTFTELEGNTVLADETDSFGNSAVEVLDAMGAVESLEYANEFEEVEGFIEAKTKAGELPIKAYAQYVVNNDASADDTGYLFGVGLGKAKEPGQVEFGYNYRDLEKDAVLGAMTDSDSFGGGTDGKGHKLMGKLKIAKNFDLGATYFMQEAGTKDYDRLQIDLKLKF